MKASQTRLAEWGVAAGGFPAAGTPRDKLGFALQYAVQAPSNRNTQPWLFRLHADAVDLYADQTRALPVADPHGRELTISCGTALFFLRLALRCFGYKDETDLFPDAETPDLLARVRLGAPHEPTGEETALFQVLPARYTQRSRFAHRPVPEVVLESLRAAARAEGAWLHLACGKAEQAPVADLVWKADRRLWANKRFRLEVAAWIHPSGSGSPDGIPVRARGVGNWLSHAALLMPTFDLGRPLSSKYRKMALAAPALALLSTDRDRPADWLATGQALARVLLQACVADVAASFFNQPIQVPEMRPQVADALKQKGVAQVLLGLGYGPTPTPTPRRHVHAVAALGTEPPSDPAAQPR